MQLYLADNDPNNVVTEAMAAQVVRDLYIVYIGINGGVCTYISVFKRRS